jgi:hypothetical protein
MLVSSPSARCAGGLFSCRQHVAGRLPRQQQAEQKIDIEHLDHHTDPVGTTAHRQRLDRAGRQGFDDVAGSQCQQRIIDKKGGKFLTAGTGRIAVDAQSGTVAGMDARTDRTRLYASSCSS